MSLVNYNSSSDEEISNGEDEAEDKVDAKFRSVDHVDEATLSQADKPTSKSSLFSTLPAPKTSLLSTQGESDSKHPPDTSSSRGALNLPAPKKRPGQPIKITAPSLPETNSDDEEEEPSSKKAKPAKSKRNLSHHSLGTPANNTIGSHLVCSNHLAAEDHMEPRTRCPPGLDPSPLGRKKNAAVRETDEHTMEELVEFSRSAMEQLHRKLELQRQQLALLTGVSGLNPRGSAPLQAGKEASMECGATSAAQMQGLMHALPPGWHLQGGPIVSATLHPGLAPFMQTPGFEPRTTVLGAPTLPFALPVSAGAGSHANNLSKNMLNPLSFAPVNPGSVSSQPGMPRFPLNTTLGISQPLAYPAAASSTHQPSPPADTGQEVHCNCCSACLKRIDLLENKVKRILEHLISKELSQGVAVPSSVGPFPGPSTPVPQSSSPQVISLNSDSPSGTSTVQTPSTIGQEFHNAFIQALQHQEQSIPSGSSSKPKVVYPRQPSDPPIPVKVTPPPENDKYAYQTLMRYRGTSKLFRIESDLHAAQKASTLTDQGNNMSQLSMEDSPQMDSYPFPPVIHSAAVFESLPPKIQNILNVVERDQHGAVTRLEVKQEILTSLAPYIKDRSSISRRLADVLFTDDERCFCNCSGWRKPAALDPIRMQALTDAVFKLCPCLDDQKKHLWHECVKSIDAASRHIVRLRKNKGKMPRQGKWLPSSNQDQGDKPSFIAPAMEVDPSPGVIDYDNLPPRLESVLDIMQRDASGRVCKVEIKEPVLLRFTFLSNSRLNVACQLADILFTPEERKGTSCLGRHGKRQLDPIRVEALREATFRICPAPLTEQKHLWSYCIKAIDRLTSNPEMTYPTLATSPVCSSDNDDAQTSAEATAEDGNQSTIRE